MAKCGSCDSATINGLYCHETGCPDAYTTETRECRWCGTEFRPMGARERECSPCCTAAYSGHECGCEECAMVPAFDRP